MYLYPNLKGKKKKKLNPVTKIKPYSGPKKNDLNLSNPIWIKILVNIYKIIEVEMLNTF